MSDFKTENGILKYAENKDMLCAVIPEEIKQVSDGAFSRCGSLCVAEVHSEEVAGYIPAGVLILHREVKKLSGGSCAVEKPFSFVREFFHDRPVDGGVRLSPIVYIPEGLAPSEDFSVPSTAVICAPEGSAGERFAREHSLRYEPDLRKALERLLRDIGRNISACEKRKAAFERDLKRAQADGEKLVQAEQQRLEAQREQLNAEIERFREQLEQEKSRAEELTEQERSTEKDLSDTFFLNKRRKDELTAELEEIRSELTAVRLRVNTLPVKIHALEVELDNPLANEVLRQAKERCEKLSAGAEHFRALIERLSACESVLKLKLDELSI